MNIKRILLVLSVFAFLMLEPVSAFAAESDRMPDLTDEAGNLTVYFMVQKTGVDTPLSGAHVAINKVADLNVKGGSAEYTVTKEFSNLQKLDGDRDVTFAGISVSDSIALAKVFALQVGDPESEKVTGEDGRCSFENLDRGMYLVREVSAEGDATEFEFFEPYFISVPLARVYVGENEWLYDVLSEPKTVEIRPVPSSEPSPPISSEPSPPVSSEPSPPDSSPHSEPESPTPSSDPGGNPVLTGEYSYIFIVFGVMFASALISVLIHRKKKTDTDGDE